MEPGCLHRVVPDTKRKLAYLSQPLPLPLGLLPAARCSHLPLNPSGISIFLSWGWISEFKPYHAPELSVLTQEFGIHCKLRFGDMSENHWFEFWVLGRRYPEGMALKPEFQRHSHRGMTLLGHHCCFAPVWGL